jgi:hypothetical protein
MNRRARSLRPTFGIVVVLTVGCSLPPAPIVYDATGMQPTTSDGLHRVYEPRVGAVFVRPGAEFSGYGAVTVDLPSVSYKEEPRPATSMNRRRGNFALRTRDIDRMKQFFQETFVREFDKSDALRVATKGSQGVLLLQGHIVNLVIDAPPALAGERDFRQAAGEMTLILDVRDAVTGEALARLADRRAIAPGKLGIDGGYESTPVTSFGAMRDAFTEWARLSRDYILELRQLEIPPAPELAPGERPGADDAL